MSVIAPSRLLRQRLRMLERRRFQLLEARRGATVPGALPGWAAEVLRRVGMTTAEIDGFGAEADFARLRRRNPDADQALAELDRVIEQVEDQLMTCDLDGLDDLQLLAETAVGRLRQGMPDAASGRALALMERLLAELRRLDQGSMRQAV